ncbi:MAG: hypothetical protein HYV63_31675 [Candidatus Schekmanbacteria bacterium]|nr:hypothetical protein [Candidatus Schekmanbacteria bacterium]
MAQDETFHPPPCLVSIEPVSHFILLARYSEKRDAVSWGDKMRTATCDLDVGIVPAVSDEANGLLAHAPGERIAKADIDWWHDALLEDPEGVNKVIRALRYRLDHSHGETRRMIKEHLTYVENHRHQMRYATYRARHLPIGSGVQEGACKTLVTQRLKRSRMSWRIPGGQAILTMRSWNQSNRFEVAFQELLSRFQRPFTGVGRIGFTLWVATNRQTRSMSGSGAPRSATGEAEAPTFVRCQFFLSRYTGCATRGSIAPPTGVASHAPNLTSLHERCQQEMPCRIPG